MRRKFRTPTAIAALTVLLGSAVPAAARDVVIHAGTLFDGVSTAPRSKVSIIVKDDRITGLENGFVTPEGAEIVDLSTATVLPGFIDMHNHVTGGGARRDRLRGTVEQQAFQSAWNVRAILNAGFTSVRDLGGDIELLSALRDSINAGVIPGPRLTVSGPSISATAGPGDASNSIDPRWERKDDWKIGVIDGPQSAIRAVRELHKRGANVIKITSTGGVASPGNNPALQLLTDEELAAIVKTAHALNIKVASHAHGKKGIDSAVRAGVDSIEHGTYADAETYKLMKERGTYMVPTLFAGQEIYTVAVEKPDSLPPGVAEKAIAVTPMMKQNALNAYKAGVKMALGTDQLGHRPHGENAKELEYLVAAGVKPVDAIMMGTRDAAALLGQSANVGSIQQGRFADIVAVRGDPAKDITELQRMQFVMKGGKIYKKDGAAILAD